ncbi:MAG TPA: hypothetical protein VFW45_10475 [Candidatus Polarisedimenticolia bacterium]|nr:hypothetical protein [Candidatus Polarisedimenticolia bacterium]
MIWTKVDKSRCALAVLTFLKLAGQSLAQEYRTPRAGEPYTGTVFGHQVEVPARDRTKATALDLGVVWIPDGPDKKEINPFAAFFLWRNRNEGRQRFRATLVGIYDDIRFDFQPSHGPFEMLATFENLTPPFDRSEYVEGIRISSEELRWYQAYLGLGAGFRIPLSPGNQENALEVALSYEPGYLAFDEGDETDPGFIVPQDTYEGRIHLRFRADALERNFIELPHAGYATGIDAFHARRAHWEDWGPTSGPADGSSGQEWNAIRVYAVAAMPVPFAHSERHRLVTSVYGGKTRDVDRFSAFHLGGGPLTADWEALSRPVLPAVALEEITSEAYGILNLEYRYELLFFSYLRVRGTLAQVDRVRFDDAGGTVHRVEPMNALTLGITTGFLWHSQLELGYGYNFGVLRQREGRTEAGDGAILLHWSKSF